MRTPQEVAEGIRNLFANFSQNWIIVIEAVFLFLIIYFVLKILYENNAKKLIPVYVLLIVCAGAVSLFSRDLTTGVYYIFILLISLFFLLLFSVEIKRSIWNRTKRTIVSSSDAAAKNTAVSARADEYITNIVKAVQALSKSNTGALIVLSNGNLPKEIIDSGVTLNANISNQLIEGIFIPKAPLHDGAMVIYGDKIQAAGCFLPLTQKDFPKDYGTRHRAGIGVTEVADVSTIIVSEETGIITIAQRGKISRYADYDLLRKTLGDYYWKDLGGEGRKR